MQEQAAATLAEMAFRDVSLQEVIIQLGGLPLLLSLVRSGSSTAQELAARWLPSASNPSPTRAQPEPNPSPTRSLACGLSPRRGWCHWLTHMPLLRLTLNALVYFLSLTLSDSLCLARG